MDLSPKLARLREIIDEKEAIGQRDKALSAEKSAIERDLIQYSETSGLDKFSASGMSVSITDAMRFKYDPAKWSDILKWAVDNNYDYIVHRRTSDAKIEELMLEGVALPDGLTPDPYKAISTRRI